MNQEKVSGDNAVSADVYYEEESGCGTVSNRVIETLQEVKDAELKPYKNYYYKSVTSKKSKYILNTYNYRQETLNSYYRAMYGSTVTGTCSMVAGTSLAEYYTRKGYSRTLGNSKYNRIFTSMVQMGYGSGAYTGRSTTDNKFHKVISAYYQSYEKNVRGDFENFFVDNYVASYNKNAKPVVGHFHSGTGHSMVIAGYYDITVKYQKTKNSRMQTKTIRYYAVNNGWTYSTAGDARISYINSKYLKSITRII